MYERGTGAIADNLTHILEEHAHKPSMVYPTLANGITIASGGAWALGSFVEIIPSGTVLDEFDIHYINIEAVSASDVYEIVLYVGELGSEVEISRARAVRTSTPSGVSSVPIQGPIHPTGSRISGKLASASGADNMTLSLSYHTY